MKDKAAVYLNIAHRKNPCNSDLFYDQRTGFKYPTINLPGVPELNLVDTVLIFLSGKSDLSQM